VVISLVLAGALTWFLVRDLEFQSAQDQLGRRVATVTVQVRHQECFTRPPVVSNIGATPCPRPGLASQTDFLDRLNSIVVPTLSASRLLLLDSNRRVIFDSAVRTDIIGMQIPVTESKRMAGVSEASTSLDGQTYFAAAIKIPPARDPLNATWVVLAQPQSLTESAAAGDLGRRLLYAGGAALIVAMLLILVISRSLTRPLTQLASAAEDIAGGNYSRRVGIKGSDEIGMLGSSFNRMAEAVERARKIQRDFLANVSHELKTPLTSLIGFSQALIDGSLLSEVERTRAATIIHEESERVLRMAQELLDLARVEAGTMSLHITAVDLSAQLEQETEIVRKRADLRKLSLQLAVPEDIPPVAADPERLHQVFENLLDNAVKYAPEGSTVHAMARLSGGAVETVISNPTGPHRPDPDRMFDRFYRADPSRSGAAGGVGLGLSIARELIAVMKGRLWADFDEAGNLRVHLMLPAARDAKPKPEPVAGAEKASLAS
jgi:signal transduction histidine kinase